MKQVAEDVALLRGRLPIPYAINTYLVGDVLVDAGGKTDTGVILKELRGRPLSAHAITHAHPDHQGASHRVCEEFGVPFWVPEADVPPAENPDLIGERQPNHPIAQLMHKVFTGPGHKVDRALVEGDEVAGFAVLDTPGHSAGHMSLWRESDRTLILGDVLNSMDPLLGIRGLREPKDFFTPDPARNRQSAKRLGRAGAAAGAVRPRPARARHAQVRGLLRAALGHALVDPLPLGRHRLEPKPGPSRGGQRSAIDPGQSLLHLHQCRGQRLGTAGGYKECLVAGDLPDASGIAAHHGQPARCGLGGGHGGVLPHARQGQECGGTHALGHLVARQRPVETDRVGQAEVSGALRERAPQGAVPDHIEADARAALAGAGQSVQQYVVALALLESAHDDGHGVGRGVRRRGEDVGVHGIGHDAHRGATGERADRARQRLAGSTHHCGTREGDPRGSQLGVAERAQRQRGVVLGDNERGLGAPRQRQRREARRVYMRVHDVGHHAVRAQQTQRVEQPAAAVEHAGAPDRPGGAEPHPRDRQPFLFVQMNRVAPPQPGVLAGGHQRDVVARGHGARLLAYPHARTGCIGPRVPVRDDQDRAAHGGDSRPPGGGAPGQPHVGPAGRIRPPRCARAAACSSPRRR